ncbi:secreted Ly-6/uPAR-related protein 1-like [Eleutherodactylus coqui]|uniref:secreted Ly-6/uPAR-related protein 1-like n=1 Tax=Eleutherodactylus coqui TaxID=57060 RepID=UPI003463046A
MVIRVVALLYKPFLLFLLHIRQELKMKRFVILLLATAVLWDFALPLKCYTCIEKPKKECTEEKDCKPDEKFCKTVTKSPKTRFPFDGDTVVTRDCAENCQSVEPNIGVEETVSCCQTDLC